MSKTNSLNKKTSAFDILYRVVTAIMAVVMFPAFYFADLFTFEIAHTSISNLLGGLSIDSTEGMNGTLHTTYDSISISELPQLLNTISTFTGDDFDFKTSILQNALYRPVIVAVVFIAIALIIGLVILGFAIFSNRIKIITALSSAGFLCTLASYISFTSFFAKKVLAGDITLAQLLNIDGIISSTLVGLVGEVILFTLDGAFYAVMFLMLGILAWSISVMIVNFGEEKEKQIKATAKKK